MVTRRSDRSHHKLSSGAFGWLSLGDNTLPGNLGHWDQVAALKFLYENIHHFGGDPKKIIVWGGSAGGASASALSLSPHSRDMVDKVIMMSGSLYAEWSNTNRVVATSRKLVKALGVSAEDTKKVKECLKTKTVDEIQETTEKLGLTRQSTNAMIYNPRIDGDFFPEPYEDLVKNAPKKPTMAGYSVDEGSILTVLKEFNGVIDGTILDYDQQKTFSKSDLEKFIEDVVAPASVFGKGAKEIQEKLKEFYINRDHPIEPNNKFYVQRYCDIVSDTNFNVPVLNDAISKHEQGWPVYVYLSEYINEKMIPENIFVRGSPHLSEYPVLYGFSFYSPFELDENDYKYQKYWIQAISSFVKNGKPTVDTLNWTEFDPKKLNFMKFSLEPRLEDGLKREQLEFWNGLTKSYDFDIVKGIQKNDRKTRDEL